MAVEFTTGRLPGRPRHSGVICVFGPAPKPFGAAGLGASLNIFVCVLSSTCTSNPSTGSNSSSALSKSMRSGLAMGSILGASARGGLPWQRNAGSRDASPSAALLDQLWARKGALRLEGALIR